ncbi:MAG: hypothetical protein K0U78_14375 [Actinomycetia bacterium]|nr:hypothetical protein [Actinomycetes bacterium]
MTALRTLIAARAMRADRPRPTTPAELAQRLIPGYVVTPTIRLISDVLHDAITQPDRRIIISTSPRTGKSVLVSQVGPVFALMNDPDAQVIVKSYGDELAEEHSREARRLINENATLLGIELAQDKSSVGRWRVANHRGGMLAGGILSGTTGFGSTLLLVDDPVRGAADADSAAHRRRLLAEFKSSLLSRLHPGASCVIVMSRWSELDLAGELLAEPDSPWTYVNVPAISEAGIPDALGREPGVAMVSALGRTAEGFGEIKRAVGSRAWFALYEGVPSSPEGGLVKREWLDEWRLPAAPQRPVKTVVGVDPSDSGSGDSCGIVAASMTSDGVVAVIADQSAPMTSDAWARAAVQLADDVGASEIAVEAFAARETYTRVVNEALKRAKLDRPIKVSGWPPKGSQRGRGDSMARSSALLQALEVGTCRIAGHLPALEEAAVTWQQGQHQPDALSALVVAHDVLIHAAGQTIEFGVPMGNVVAMQSFLSQRIG